MNSDDRIEELRKIRTHLDENMPNWREAEMENGKRPSRIDFYIETNDGLVLDFVLFQRADAEVQAGG